ncbi:MAG: hypothetical protein R3B13_06235 [Polyangiaceae bacterium]
MNPEELDAMLAELPGQDLDRYRREQARELAHGDLRRASTLHRHKLQAFESALVAVACVVYLTWAMLRAFAG